MANIPGNQNNAGRSLIEMIQAELDRKMAQWLSSKDQRTDILRGQIRGLAISLSILLRPYDELKSTAKLMEKASKERVKSNGN